ncbi:MAG: hypothetical protein Q4G39_02560 [Brachymonas sp.]|nr:hypothetical protein [Brachymonas sp.]
MSSSTLLRAVVALSATAVLAACSKQEAAAPAPAASIAAPAPVTPISGPEATSAPLTEVAAATTSDPKNMTEWRAYTADDGSKISVRYYQADKGGVLNDFAELELNGETHNLFKVGSEKADEMAYGDGNQITLVKRNKGASMVVSVGDALKTYK